MSLPPGRKHFFRLFFSLRDMAQRLKELAAIPENPNSVPSTYMVAHKDPATLAAKVLAGWWWRMPLITALRRQRQEDL